MELNFKFDPLGDGVSFLEYIQHAGSDKMIVNAARVSYAKDNVEDAGFNDKDRKLLKFLLEHNHGSPLEHNLITFKIKAPLYVIQELLRHRIGCSFNQESHRYIEPSKKEINPERKFYLPVIFRKQDDKNRQCSSGDFSPDENVVAEEIYLKSCNDSFSKYEELLSLGVSRELARGVLPHSTYSSLYFTCNIRSLVHFLGLRLASGAQKEIRMYAECMYKIAKEIFPNSMELVSELNLIPL